MKIKKLQHGVSLFELILVMMIVALMTVAAIRYADRQRDEAVAERLAQKLFEYGQAARKYAFDHQEDIESGNMDLEYAGVAWLQPDQAGYTAKNEPYLRDSFTFTQGLDPLYLGTYDGKAGTIDNTDKDIIYTTLSWNAEENHPEIGIEMGSLYDPNTGVDEDGAPNPPQILPDITAEAASLASVKYDSTVGFAAISYNMDLSSGRFPNIPVSGTLARTTTQQQDYLRVDGQNYMEGYLDFIDAETHGVVDEDHDNYGIRYIESIEFDANANTLTQINYLGQLNFDATSTDPNNGIITDVMDINFASLREQVGTHMETIYVEQCAGLIYTSCWDVPKQVEVPTIAEAEGAVTFHNGVKMDTMQYIMCKGDAADSKKLLTYRYNDSQDASICFVMGDRGDSMCEIGRSTGLNPRQYYIGHTGQGSGGACFFGCIVWDRRALHDKMCHLQDAGGYRAQPG